MRALAGIKGWAAESADVWFSWAMILLGVLGLYLMGIDQGMALGVFVGEVAMRYNWLHELFHDARHIMGFPCH